MTTCAFVFVRKFGSCCVLQQQTTTLHSVQSTILEQTVWTRPIKPSFALVLSEANPQGMPTLRRRTAEPSTSLPPTSLPRTRPALSMLTPMLPPPCFTASRAPCVLGRTATRRNESKVRAYLGLAIAASCLTPVAHTLCKPELRCKPSHRSGL